MSDSHSTDEANRLESDDSYSYVYDLNGNLTAKLAKDGTGFSDWAYRYDALDQLIEVEQNGSPVERYRYQYFHRFERLKIAQLRTLNAIRALLNRHKRAYTAPI